MYKTNTTILELYPTSCFITAGNVCQKQQNDNNWSSCTQAKSILGLLLDPSVSNKLKVTENQRIVSAKESLSSLNTTSSLEGAFKFLWYTSLPCFDVNGITSTKLGEHAMLKSCSWKGIKIPCAAIFNPFPTDQGMCCSFNMKAADEIFQQETYSKLVMDSQNSDKRSAFEDYNLPKWFIEAKEPKIQPGMSKGLTVLIDAHNDILSPSSVDTDYQGFTGIVANRESYPLIQREGFHIQAGHFNLIGLSATKITGNAEILGIDPKKRKCLFKQENSGLKIHKIYSQSSCLLECAIFYARGKMLETKNITKSCSPWFLPTSEKFSTICGPWDAVEFEGYFSNVPDDKCKECLPDCDTVIYEPSVSTIPFRRCDFRNLGVSPLCNLDDILLPEPQIWAKQVLDELSASKDNQLINQINYRIKSSQRRYFTDIFTPGNFNLENDSYNAYEKDIAIVQFYFKTATIMEFETTPSQTWVSFLSTIGGLLGLCIGLSIMTLVEIFWLSLNIVSSFLKPLPRSKN